MIIVTYKHHQTYSKVKTKYYRQTISKLGKIKERLGLRTNFLMKPLAGFYLLQFDYSIIIDYLHQLIDS